MMTIGSLHRLLPLTRRHLFLGAGLALGAMVLPKRVGGQSITNDDYRILHARRGSAHLRGENEQPTPIWGYDGVCPGPTLRIKQGDELKVRLVKDLDQATTVHWHGLRLPNGMDGVPHLTQVPIEPGQSFDYHFAAPDAGTLEQLARGLYGILIVEEREPVEVDRARFRRAGVCLTSTCEHAGQRQ